MDHNNNIHGTCILNVRDLKRSIERPDPNQQTSQILRGEPKETAFREFLARSYDAAILCNWEGGIQECNRRAEEFFNLAKSDLLKLNVGQLFAGADDNFCQMLAENLAEHRHIVMEADCQGNYVEFPSETVIFSVSVLGSPMLMFQIRNISRRRQLEEQVKMQHEELVQTAETLQIHQAQLLESEKRTVIGTVASGVAHQINNPLQSICLNMEALEEYIGDLTKVNEGLQALAQSTDLATDVSKLLGKVEELDLNYVLNDSKTVIQETLNTVWRVGNIVSSLGQLAKQETRDENASSLLSCIENTLVLLEGQIAQKADLQSNYQDYNVDIKGSGSLSYVLMHLVQNACDAIQGSKGLIELIVSIDESYLYISVIDNGIGMSDEEQNKLFTPFYSTKQDSANRHGMGLYVSFGLVKDLGGKIIVKSKKGRGSEFLVTLPKNNEGSYGH